MRQRALAAIAFLVCVAGSAPSLAAAKPDRVSAFPPNAPHRAPWSLNRELLLPVNERITFLVDVPRGAQPKVEALDHVARLAAKYGGRQANWQRLEDYAGSMVRWVDRPDDDASKSAEWLVSSEPPRSPDNRDTTRIERQVLKCEGGELPSHTTFVFIRYIGWYGRVYGDAIRSTTGQGCGDREYVVLFLPQSQIALQKAPGIPQTYLELRALAHEYGHALGAGSNPEHGWWMRAKEFPYQIGPHCVNHECAASVPTAGAILDGKMHDLCSQCVHDIENARQYWLEGTLFPESPRLPQPDAEKEVARLKAYQFREGGVAERLLSLGKAAMPPLMTRMETLKGGLPSSPREQAAWLVAKVIATEDAKRREDEGPTLAPLDEYERMSEALLRWWQQQGDNFMSGDDWTLPAFTRAP